MAVAADVRNVVETPIAQLHPSQLQPRTEFPDDYLQSLAESIRRNSVITPLLVRPSRKGFEIIDGECRWRAAKIAGLETVPVDVQELGDLEAMNRILASFENRRALGDLDEGRAFKRRMLLGGDDAARVAASIGLSERYVYDAIKLVDDLIPDAQQLLQRGLLTRSHAILISRLKADDQARVIDPDNDKLWSREATLRAPDLFEEDAEEALDEQRETDPYAGMKFDVSVRELERYIAHHFRFDPQHPTNIDLFPETVKAVEEAESAGGRGKKVIHITHDYRAHDDVRKDELGEKVYGAQSWRLADGSSTDAPTCDLSVLGLVVAGPGYGSTLTVCVRRDKCETHFGKEIKARAKAAKTTTSRTKANKAWERQQEQRRQEEEAEAREEKRWPTVRQAIKAAAIDAVKKTPLATLEKLLTSDGYGQAAKVLPGKATPDLILRRLALGHVLRIDGNYRWARDNYAHNAAKLGVDVKAVVVALDSEAKPSSAAKKPAKKGAAKK